MSLKGDRYRIIESPTGPFALIRQEDGGLRTTWLHAAHRTVESATLDPDLLPDLAARIEAYFRGEEVDFFDVPLPAAGGFFRRCWQACRQIPRGSTLTYGELAQRAGSSTGAARAAGQAMRNNPLPVIVPCHRVIASGGRLHGFAGSTDPAGPELVTKRRLLALEGALDGQTTAAAVS